MPQKCHKAIFAGEMESKIYLITSSIFCDSSILRFKKFGLEVKKRGLLSHAEGELGCTGF